MTKRDDQAASFYEDEANLAPTGPSRRRAGQSKRLSNHVPVRFDPELLQHVRGLAVLDGVSVSTWIRNSVQREVERRLPKPTQTKNSAHEDSDARVQGYGSTLTHTSN